MAAEAAELLIVVRLLVAVGHARLTRHWLLCLRGLLGHHLLLERGGKCRLVLVLVVTRQHITVDTLAVTGVLVYP